MMALNSEHRPTLQALIEVYAKNNDWKQVAAYKRQVLDTVYDTEERYKLLMDLGDTWAERDKNPHKAIEALEEAAEIKPQDHVLLHKLLQLYQQAGDWQKMIDTIQAISDLEEKPEIKARYLYTQAQLYRWSSCLCSCLRCGPACCLAVARLAADAPATSAVSNSQRP